MTSQFTGDNRGASGSLAFTMRTLPAAFQATRRVDPDSVALRTVGDHRSITWRSYGQRVRRIAEGLDAIGLKFTDTLGIMLVNRPEFHLFDTAALHLGAVPFSIYNTMATEQLRYVCGNAGNRIMVTERRFLRKLLTAGIAFDHIVCVDARVPGVLSLSELVRLRSARFDFDATWRRVHPADLATITYTSGTTGSPKGVELTHANILAQLDGLADHARRPHRVLSARRAHRRPDHRALRRDGAWGAGHLGRRSS